ncbi:MAG: YeeE/YedE family protein [Limnohabitans sp.]
MNLASLIETWGDAHVLAAGGAMIGLVFGFMAQRSRFCARAAVLECCGGQPGDRLSVWWLAFGAALLGTQLLVLAGALQPASSRFIANPGSLSGAVLGGLCFGAGMILTRGCASRLLILSANGNLRALLSGLVFAVTVQASLAGWLAPARQFLYQLWPIDGGPARDLQVLSGTAPWGGLVIAAMTVAAGLYFFWRQHRGRPWLALGAVSTGLCIAAGWAFTQAVARQSFEPVALTSLSFSGPSAEWLMRVLSTSSVPGFGFDAGLLPATFIGSLLGALVGGDFRFEGFKTENKLGHYLTGAVLMGFGAVLAGGCTVGAGMTGGAIFALTAWLTLISIWLGAAVALRLHKAMGWAI